MDKTVESRTIFYWRLCVLFGHGASTYAILLAVYCICICICVCCSDTKQAQSLLYFLYLYLYLYLYLRVCVFSGHGASTRHCRSPELHLPPLAFGGDLLFSKFSMFEKEIRAGSHILLVACFGTYHKQRILSAILVSTKLGLKPVVLLPYLTSYDILKV